LAALSSFHAKIVDWLDGYIINKLSDAERNVVVCLQVLNQCDGTAYGQVVVSVKKPKVCQECGMPRDVAKENRWQNDGTISSFRTGPRVPVQRTLYYEVDGLNDLFMNIEKLIGQPISLIVAEGRRKNINEYLEEYFSGLRGVAARSIGRRTVYNTIAKLGAIFGLGHFEVRDIRKGRYVKVYGRDTYSIPLLSGDLMAAFNAVERLPASVDVEVENEGLIFTVSRSEEPEEEISSRLETPFIPTKPGSIQFERCKSCGAHIDMKHTRFDLDRGVITDETTGRRMTFTGMSNFEAILRELQVELGEEIILSILTAQKDYTKSTVQRDEIATEADVRHFLAIRGMGNLIGYELDNGRLEAEIDNARPYTLVIGLLHGIFELLTGKEGKVDYSLAGDGTLTVIIGAI
jgi:hypothetical protein